MEAMFLEERVILGLKKGREDRMTCVGIGDEDLG